MTLKAPLCYERHSFSNLSTLKNQSRFQRDKPKRKEVNNEMKSAVETTDLFRGAYFLCNGGIVLNVRLEEGPSRLASFLIEGEGLDRLELEYRNGQATVNPLQFRESLNHLRDILFNTLRKRGDRHDRERKNRGAKKKH